MAYTIYYPYYENMENIKFLTSRQIEDCEEEYYDECEDDGYMFNFVHVLQSQPLDRDIKVVEKTCPNIHVIYVEPLDVYALAIKGAGMDFSEELELAYLILDGVSPIKSEPFYLGEVERKMIKELRKEWRDPKALYEELTQGAKNA